MLPETFFTQLRQVFEADPSDWDARAWSHARDSLSCEWHVLDTDGGDTDGGVWQMECGRVPKVYASDSSRVHSSPTISEGPGDPTSSEDWKRCFLQLSVSDFVEIISGEMNANTAVFENRLRLAGDLESLPLLNIALVKMKALVKLQQGDAALRCL